MSLEQFQNVDDWLVNGDVSVLSSWWKEEDLGCVPGLDDNDDYRHGCYVTLPADNGGLERCEPSLPLNSPTDDHLPDWWLGRDDIWSWCGKEAGTPLTSGFSGGELQSLEQLSNLETDGRHLPEVSISELESLLMIDHTEAGADAAADQSVVYVTVDPGGLEYSKEDSTIQYDDIDSMEDQPEIPAHESEDEDLASDDDDVHDATWTCRSQACRTPRRSAGQRQRRKKRQTPTRGADGERKKQQNKSAATRYREKKRSEEIENELMCAALEKRNRELRARVQDMTHEATLLRQLVIEIFKGTPNVCSA